ncbi:MAG: type I glyceraldehyde-3-phosphate dehydrogenase [Oligoflexia bacterium]|nr:type I glyceraldehyde-3-phosphate dehydrogenase [Oligoflexia bacterium]
MRPKVGINGFGRIGRVLFRAGFERLDVCAINDTSDVNTIAHLLKYDSIHGRFPGKVEAKDGKLIVNGKTIPVYSTKDPGAIPWKEFGVDLVLECTGAMKKKEDAAKHIQNGGAKRVMISAPADDSDLTIVMGVNHKQYDPKKHTIVSNASCTTNCLAPIAKVLNENFGIEHGLMTTVHSYTNDQRIMDSGHKDLRRARAAALSMIPTTTGAAKTVGKVIPELKGKIDGTSVRVPTPNVSLVDFVANIKKDTTVEQINEVLKKAASQDLKNIMVCEEDELVSTDFNGNAASSVIDLPSTMVIGNRMIKVMAWYDNETGFSNRMVDLALYMSELGL